MKILLFVSFLAICVTQDAPEIKIDQGTLRGTYRRTWKGKQFRGFTGIPYAKPPVGDLRFKVAEPADPWDGVLDASKPHAICPQIDIFFNDMEVKGDEDCLYLNVYTPKIKEPNKDLLPVMFFIHGGGFTSGSANPDLYGPDILLEKDIVMVTANYRLGALGFLSTEDEIIPGNNGLKDQNLVLKWIKQNIIHFGGDPDKITVFGQSAGGASTHYHMLSPLSKDLLFAAIAQSGIATAPWALAPKGQAANNAKKLAEFLNCPTETSHVMIDCLKNVKAHDIIEQDKAFMEWSYDPAIPFKPVIEPNIEGAFITQHPVEIIKSGNFAHIPFMTGITTEDGAIKSAAIYNYTNLVEEFNTDFDRIAPLVFMYNELASKNAISKKIREFYLGDRAIDTSTKAELTDMFTDPWFLSPQDYAAKLHAKHSTKPVYYYLFGYRGTVSIGPFYGDPSYDYGSLTSFAFLAYPKFRYLMDGVAHCDELIYLTSCDLFDDYMPNDCDKNMNNVLTTLWENFARTGNPTSDTNDLISVKWEPVQNDDLKYYFIKSDSDISMIKTPYTERSEFWNNLPVDSDTHRIKTEL